MYSSGLIFYLHIGLYSVICVGTRKNLKITEFHFNLTGAMKIVTVASVMWCLLAILIVFVLPSPINHIVISTCGALFLVVPTINYVRMLLAVRRHNSQLADTVISSQLSAAFHLEKAVAITMFIVAILLLVSLTPALCMEIVRQHYPGEHAIIFPWGLTLALINCSVNPIVYFGRNQNLRKALKSMILSWCNTERYDYPLGDTLHECLKSQTAQAVSG